MSLVFENLRGAALNMKSALRNLESVIRESDPDQLAVDDLLPFELAKLRAIYNQQVSHDQSVDRMLARMITKMEEAEDDKG